MRALAGAGQFCSAKVQVDSSRYGLLSVFLLSTSIALELIRTSGLEQAENTAICTTLNEMGKLSWLGLR
ncbi:unnamed protein product [Nippostrongylus brasiliensis]|uniref:Uncharacterized protein n=1 Tax=Nippostrongylus brasiliensis TaxID=27835 RepID=A0A0N4YKL6_NIPBR|nr:unnamed protein product [Nippostrongylus brasiliensis]